ncbi:MAG TPA: hypothetical protein ENG73_02080 [Desulfobacterales bacterium]|nr:hypothetical protein [Desulfobacterales bacterium]
MQMIDAHVHVDSVSRQDLALMCMAGIRAVVSQTYYAHVNVTISSQTIIDLYERLIEFETWRTSQEFIDTYVAVSLNPVSIPTDYQKVLEAMPVYLEKDKVVAIGEIGLEPASKTCPDLVKQEEIVREQLRMAKQYNKPVVFHTPAAEKEKWVEKYFNLISQEGIDKTKVIIDHADGAVAKAISDFGCIAGITVQPWRNLTPADGAKISMSCPPDRVIIDSDCSPLLSDPLSVPKTAHEMRRLGMKEENIRKMVFDNAAKIFDLK